MEPIKKINLNNSFDGKKDEVGQVSERVIIPEIKLEKDKNDSVIKSGDSGADNLIQNNNKKKKIKFRKIKKPIAVIFLILLVLLLLNGVFTYRIYIKGIKLKNSVDKLVESTKSQDLNKVSSELKNTKKSLNELKQAYAFISWTKFLPYFGKYLSDGNHIINAAYSGIEGTELFIETVAPYADLIGFSGGQQALSGNETAQDRIDFIIKSLPDIIPKADGLIAKVKETKEEIDKVDPNKYPEKVAGKPVKETLKKVISQVDLYSDFVIRSKPLLEAAPYLLGVNGQREYLVLFQNDKELRPTGGFITAYTIAKVDRGKFEPVASNDIYNLDSNYTRHIEAPEEFKKYLRGTYSLGNKYWLRDMNWSPDFSQSMQFFSEESKSAGINNIDGIIAVDTQLLVNILNVVGNIGVSGYGDFSTQIVPECNCPQVIYELESFADVEGPIVWSENEPGKIIFAPEGYFERSDNRKKIIGPLMNSVLSNTLGQPKEKIPALFEAMFASLLEKHVLFYMHDQKTQEALEKFGIAGKIEDFEGDYLHINDANLGGRKSNLYVSQEVEQEVSISRDGSVEKIVRITYKNPEKQDGWLNSILPNYVRIYVPKGSQLIDFSGIEEEKEPYEEFGKTVYSGFFNLRPLGVANLELKYKLPFKVKNNYQILIQKQPGKDKPLYILKVGRKEEEFYLNTDRKIKFNI